MSDDTYNEDRDDLLTELIDAEDADDTRELHKPCATPNSLFSTLQKEYNGLLVNDTTVEYIKSSQSLHTLRDHINHVKENHKWARTGRLWLMLMQIVAIIRMLIRSERTGNWYLHLKATQDMLPYFAAAGHNNYAKCCRLFTSDDPTQLRNMSTGVVADHRVSVDDALTIGAKIQERLTGGKFGDVTMKKKDQAQTFSITRKPIKIDGEDVCMSPAQLYHRLLCIASTNGPPDPSIFSYEMTTVAPALFKEECSMRTSQRSQLAKHIVGKYPNITRKQSDNSAGRVYDGCALIHRLAWPKVGTMGSVCETFVGYVLAPAAPHVHVCVLFDCYDRQTTKAPIISRCRTRRQHSSARKQASISWQHG